MNQEAVWTDAADTMPVEILRQTFQVRTGAGTGTAFTVEVDGRQYIVTAQHVIGPVTLDVLDMQTSSAGWRQVPVMAVGMAGPPVDVAVMATDSVLGSRSSVPVGVGTVNYGQPCASWDIRSDLTSHLYRAFAPRRCRLSRPGYSALFDRCRMKRGFSSFLSMLPEIPGSAEGRWSCLDVQQRMEIVLPGIWPAWLPAALPIE